MSLLLTNSDVRERKLKRNDHRPLPARWRYVVELHLAGHQVAKATEKQVVTDGVLETKTDKLSITELTGFAPSTIYKILASEAAQLLKQQIMSYYDSEFETLYPQVIEAIRRGLDSGDKYLDAAKLYLKAFGKQGVGAGGTPLNLTAEDVVVNILNQR